MKTKIEKQEKNTAKLDITIDAKNAVDEYNKACKRISTRVNIAGFRKGKAPRNIIEKHVGTDTIKKDVLDYMLPKMVSDAIKENNLDVVTEPFLESFDFEVGSDVHACIRVELRPEIKLGKYKGLKVEVEEYQVEKDFLEKELAFVQNKFTSTEPVYGRKTLATDVLIFDFDGEVDGEPIQSGSAKNYMLDIANSNFIPGFAEQLIDKEISEEFTIDVNFPDNYQDEKLKGKKAKFKIKINEIKGKVIPELNDELAKKVGPYNSLDDLKKEIEQYAKNIATAENTKRSSEAIFDMVLESSEMEIQDSMIERESQSLLGEMRERFAGQGADFNSLLEREGQDKVMSEVKGEALRRIKNSLVIHKISAEEKIEVTMEDLNKKIDELAKSHGVEKSVIFEQLRHNNQIINSLNQQAISEKISKFLLENNEIKYIKEKKK